MDILQVRPAGVEDGKDILRLEAKQATVRSEAMRGASVDPAAGAADPKVPQHDPNIKVWTLRGILDETPPTQIVRRFMRANCTLIINDEEEGLFTEYL